MSVLLLGFDTESEYSVHVCTAECKIKKEWLDKSLLAVEVIIDVLKKSKARATFFMLGLLLEIAGKEFQHLLGNNELFDVESHTYSHVRIKPPNAVSLPKLAKELRRTRTLTKEYFGIDVLGLRAPRNFYQGMQGYPDILHVIWDSKIRFLGSDGRGPDDCEMPAPFTQPYWYKKEGFPQLLEMPITGWQDPFLTGTIPFSWKNIVVFPTSETLDHLPRTIDEEIAVYQKEFRYAINHDMVYSPGLHPWIMHRFDPKLTALEFLIEKAEEKKVPIMNFKDYYTKKLQEDYRGES